MIETVAPHLVVKEEAISEDFNDSLKEALIAQGPQDVIYLETFIQGSYVVSLHEGNDLVLPVGLSVLKDVQEGHSFDD